jgi:hypothetical protein
MVLFARATWSPVTTRAIVSQNQTRQDHATWRRTARVGVRPVNGARMSLLSVDYTSSQGRHVPVVP